MMFFSSWEPSWRNVDWSDVLLIMTATVCYAILCGEYILLFSKYNASLFLKNKEP